MANSEWASATAPLAEAVRPVSEERSIPLAVREEVTRGVETASAPTAVSAPIIPTQVVNEDPEVDVQMTDGEGVPLRKVSIEGEGEDDNMGKRSVSHIEELCSPEIGMGIWEMDAAPEAEVMASSPSRAVTAGEG